MKQQECGKVMAWGSFDDLLEAYESQLREKNPPTKFGEMETRVENGRLIVVMRMDIDTLPPEFTICPQNLFKEWLKHRFLPKP
jgi:hypothetical protein